MEYCDKCKIHLVDRNIYGCNSDRSIGPFQLDLCAVCYNEFRKLVREWMKNDLWAEFDQHRHNNETVGKVNLK